MTTATGTFQISMTPHAANDTFSPDIGRMHFHKLWAGDLDGHSQGEMLSVGNPTSGTASYVVLEVFTGSLGGCNVTFAFRQSGDMHAGRTDLNYEVVPHSGSGDLSGELRMNIVEKVHHYTLTYSCSEASPVPAPAHVPESHGDKIR